MTGRAGRGAEEGTHGKQMKEKTAGRGFRRGDLNC